METLKLRSREPLQWVRYLERGGVVHPLDLLDESGMR
jgi:hypothetical protein